MSDYRIALIDIENAPNFCYAWGNYEQNILKHEIPWYMLSYAYKWLGEKQITCVGLPDFKTAFHKDKYNDEKLIAGLYDVFDEADMIIWHNGDKFDRRKSNTRMLKHDFGPPSPYNQVDTLKVARREFFFNSNKLGDLAEFLELGSKTKHPGFELWDNCMHGDEAAWKLMKKYNSQDVNILEKVYLKLRPWIRNHPNVGIRSGESLTCPNCGMVGTCGPRGWRPLKSYEARLYHCYKSRGGCGAYPTSSERRKVPGVILHA